MRCPPPALLAAELAGMLTPAECAQVDAHVGACPDCAAVMADVKRLLTPREVRQAAAQAAFCSRCEEALSPAIPPPRQQRRHLLAAAALGALLLSGDHPGDRPVAELRRTPSQHVDVLPTRLPVPTREVLEARGRLAWALGVQKGRAGDFAGAIATYRSAREAYERLGDQESALWLRFLGGEAQGYLGLAAEGSRERRLAIDRLAELGAHDRVATGLVGSAILELLEERPQRAAELLGRALAAADMAGRPPYRVAVAHLWRSRLRFELGDEQGAREDLSRAHTWATRCPPEDRRELSGHLEMADGLLAQSHSAAIDSLSRAHSAFASNGRAVWLPAVLIERGRALRLAGDVAAADADLRRGRLLLAEQRRLVGERPDSALRTVQLRLLREANPDLRSTAAWAAFATLGG